MLDDWHSAVLASLHESILSNFVLAPLREPFALSIRTTGIIGTEPGTSFLTMCHSLSVSGFLACGFLRNRLAR